MSDGMDVPSHAKVVEQIDDFLTRHDMAPTTFGRSALGEASFVTTLRDGRMPGLRTLQKCAEFMRSKDEELELSIASDPKGRGKPAHRLSAGAR